MHIPDIETAQATAVHAIADAMARVTDTYREEYPPAATAAHQMAQDAMATASAAIRTHGTTAPRALVRAARENLETAHRRIKAIPAPPDAPDDPAVRACLSRIAAAAAIQFHQHFAAQPDVARAHIAAADVITENLMSDADSSLTADALEAMPTRLANQTIAAIQDTARASQAIIPARRRTMEIQLSPLAQRMEQDNDAITKTTTAFQNSAAPVMLSVSTMVDEIGQAGPMFWVMAFEHHQAIRCQIAGEPLPEDMTPAEVHQLIAGLQFHARQTAEHLQPDQQGLTIAIMDLAQRIENLADAGLQSTELYSLAGVFEELDRQGADPTTIHEAASMMARRDDELTQAILRQTGFLRMITEEQAQAIAAAATASGVPANVLAAIAHFTGAQEIAPPEVRFTMTPDQIRNLRSTAMEVGLPDDTVEMLTQLVAQTQNSLLTLDGALPATNTPSSLVLPR